MENIDDPVDRLNGVVGVQGCDDKMSRFRRGQCHGDGFQIPNLFDDDYIGILAERDTQGVRKGGCVISDLPLADQTVFVLVDILDRVRDHDDVCVPVLVHVVHERGECRGFPASRGSRDQHQPMRQGHELFHQGRESELAYGRRRDRIRTEDPAHMIPLIEEIDAETVREIGKRDRAVNLAVFGKIFFLFFIQEKVAAFGHELRVDGGYGGVRG
ncbi:MAG: hypothetical protein BWY42_01738 [Candidatus Omnitrophica bacterium ADurb.Bin277]|nr:MAG: hypothetical protein BWY42_01738 [Candidatus Omnitrophica bacterium ADurb.Bin277]